MTSLAWLSKRIWGRLLLLPLVLVILGIGAICGSSLDGATVDVTRWLTSGTQHL